MFFRIREKIDNLNINLDKVESKEIEKYTYVSFDIFDTLLKRDVKKPEDVFTLVEEIYSIKDFKKKRIDAERTARLKNISGEVSLNDIYNEYEDSEANLEDLKNKEIECELGVCTPNLDLMEFYSYCIQNKKIILISDMYLPRDVICKMLSKCGIDGYEKLYISHENKKTKLSGKLFEYVLDELNLDKSKIIHIGNSFRADYLSPIKMGIDAVKIPTSRDRLQKKYRNTGFYQKVLISYLNNHVVSKDTYQKFGYEVFGPLLYGFVNWLCIDAEKNGIKQILFLSRDGYIMKKAYDGLSLNERIPSFYFEVSRRSLRVPSFSKDTTIGEIISSLTVPNMTNFIQILDCIGLEKEEYNNILKKYNFDLYRLEKRDELFKKKEFLDFISEIRKDILALAMYERDKFNAYVAKYDFTVPTAIVDIGWGGSMQKYLIKQLRELGYNPDIKGYYVGLTLKSRENLRNNNLSAKAYAFDCLNNDDQELESSFIGLFESLFLEQKGSVKCYGGKEGLPVAIRYPYEYADDDVIEDAKAIAKVQDGALCFVKEFSGSFLAKKLFFSSQDMFNNLYDVGTRPSTLNVEQFGKIHFFNCGEKVFLAKPRCINDYVLHPSYLKNDLYLSQWKIGFLKKLLNFNMSYIKIFEILRKAANR